MLKPDVVWYWVGGEEVGEWREALPGPDVDATCAEIERGGRVSVKGLRCIGKPEGPPSRKRLAEVLRAFRPAIQLPSVTVPAELLPLALEIQEARVKAEAEGSLRMRLKNVRTDVRSMDERKVR